MNEVSPHTRSPIGIDAQGLLRIVRCHARTLGDEFMVFSVRTERPRRLLGPLAPRRTIVVLTWCHSGAIMTPSWI